MSFGGRFFFVAPVKEFDHEYVDANAQKQQSKKEDDQPGQ